MNVNVNVSSETVFRTEMSGYVINSLRAERLRVRVGICRLATRKSSGCALPPTSTWIRL